MEQKVLNIHGCGGCLENQHQDSGVQGFVDTDGDDSISNRLQVLCGREGSGFKP